MATKSFSVSLHILGELLKCQASPVKPHSHEYPWINRTRVGPRPVCPHTHKGFGLSAHMLAQTLAGRSRCHTHPKVHRFLARPLHVSVGSSALVSQEAFSRRASESHWPDVSGRNQKENSAQKSTRDIKVGCCVPVQDV